jgi:lipoprotein-anchoring transpeptidase ErfK/SrfK
MKKSLLAMSLCASGFVFAAEPPPSSPYYGTGLCVYPQFQCVKVGKGESWETLFPNLEQRNIVQKLNRSYNYLWTGKEIVVPKDLAKTTLLDIAPFPQSIDEHEKQIIVDQEKLAWGAYDEKGQLVGWGPISSGRDKCSDSNRSCRTMSGIFRVFSKENQNCKSDVYPIGKGGAKMPYCIYFHKGFALHGSDDIPGYRASHGCVRMFVQDAKWLNENFAEISTEENQYSGTKVVVRPLNTVEKL